MTPHVGLDGPHAWLSLVAVARRHEVHVCDIYRAVMDGELPARLPSVDNGRMTVLAEDADQWAASRTAGRSRVARTMLAAVPMSAMADLRQPATATPKGP